MHKVVALLLRAKLFFNTKGIADSDLIVHLPLPLHGDLMVITGDYEGVSIEKVYGMEALLFGIKCVPGYENRIVMSNPADAFITGSPVIIIEGFGYAESLTYKVIE